LRVQLSRGGIAVKDVRKYKPEVSRTDGLKARRDDLGRLLPGRSGNPAGRPRDMERRRRFIDAYVVHFDWQTRAARIAGYPERGVRVAAYRLMREPDVLAAIDAEWRAHLERQERERREKELRRAWEMAGKRARLFR
jgi:Terminase small subunit